MVVDVFWSSRPFTQFSVHMAPVVTEYHRIILSKQPLSDEACSTLASHLVFHKGFNSMFLLPSGSKIVDKVSYFCLLLFKDSDIIISYYILI